MTFKLLNILTVSFGTMGKVNRSLDNYPMGSSLSFTAFADINSLAGIAVRSAVNGVAPVKRIRLLK